ncbi:FBD-associated F-box protein [Melia azedarach]|nr:FBD-associated F-box protein [Melia azedarach]
MSKYISWVNKILQMHQSSNIKVFRINCGSGDSHNETIVTNWIYTAIAKGVEKLVLDLEGIGAKKHYGFPQECLSSIKYCSNLKSLSLVRVEVSREIVEYFIYNCGFLEALCVKYSAELSGNLKIVGNSQQQQQLKLKYLEFHCCSIEGVEINSVPSLLSFKFFGLEIMLNIENVPQLLDISVGGHKSVRLSKLVEPIMPFLPQLESLTLHLHLDQEEVPFPSCELPELRHLTFQVVGTDCKDLSELTTFMKACPYLQKLTIKLVYVGDKTRRRIRKYRNNKCCHEHLKEVEFVGFVGRPIDLELASHLLETATNLQKIIANPTCIYSVGSYYEFEDDARKRAARKRAKWIEQNLPPGVEFILL